MLQEAQRRQKFSLFILLHPDICLQIEVRERLQSRRHEEYCRRQGDKAEPNRILWMQEQATLPDTPPGSCHDGGETERDERQTDR